MALKTQKEQARCRIEIRILDIIVNSLREYLTTARAITQDI
jgi:hypothetical protein